MTGFPAEVKAIVAQRSRNACEVNIPSECTLIVTDYHHRMNRGMGGSKAVHINSASAALHVCRRCHDWIGRNVAESYEMGWLVRKLGVALPADKRVKLRGVWGFLDDEGNFETGEQR